jgi:AcrR family transcriptional regulator
MPRIKRKEKIKEVAQNMFRTRGYRATSMRTLAKSVGIKAASLYNHIESKEEILQEICFRIADEFFAAQEATPKQETNPEILLRHAIAAHVKVVTANLDAAAVFLHDWRYLSEPSLSEFKSLRKKYESLFRKIIRDGMDQKLFTKSDETFVILAIFSSLNWIYDWYDIQGKWNSDDVAGLLADFILTGIKR